MSSSLVSLVPSWENRSEVIYFTLPATDGTTGSGWIARLKRQRCYASEQATKQLLSPSFRPTSGVVNKIGVLTTFLFTSEARPPRNICAVAKRRGFQKPGAEIACLITETFLGGDEIYSMGFSGIIVMHNLTRHLPYRFCVPRNTSENGWLDTASLYLPSGYDADKGFAFVASSTYVGDKKK